MFDWLSFLAGFSIDAVVVTVLIFFLTPIRVKTAIEAWVQDELLDVILQVAKDPRMSEVRALLVKQFAGGLLGGRPGSLNLRNLAGTAIQSLIARAFSGGSLGVQTPQGAVNVNLPPVPPATPPPATP